MTPLKRTLNLAQVTFFAVGAILGAGIYTIIGKCAGLGGNMLWVSFLIAAGTAFLTALSYAELSSMFPQAGGEFVYLHEAMGKRMGYTTGIIVAVSGITGAATVALGFAGYFSGLVPIHKIIAAPGIIGLMMVINIIGIRQTAWLTVVFTLIESGGLVYIIIAGWKHIGAVNYTAMPPDGVNGIFIGAALSFFAYKGYEHVVKLSEETVKPEKNIPRSIFIASLIVVIIYVLVVFAAISAMPFNQLAESESPLADIARQEFGATSALIIGIIALFSTSNTLLSMMVASSRVVYSMSRESGKWKIFGQLSRRKTPFTALICAGIIAAAFSLIGDLRNVALIANFFVFLTAILVNLTVIILRKKRKSLRRPYRIPVSIADVPLAPVLGILLTVVLTVYTIIGIAQGHTE